ncbi:MAG: HAD family hydrolase [Spirochaetaceae bacterium]|nr:HAD family hydrolase [Spirochaetaceae bacterium]
MPNEKKKLKAILFDKDGTLFDYSRVWFDVLKNSVNYVFELEGRQDEEENKKKFLTLMGLDSNGKTISTGAIFSHNKINIFKSGVQLCFSTKMKPTTLVRMINEIMDHNDKCISNQLEKIDFTKQQEFFKDLKSIGYTLGIITVDRRVSLDIFLEDMGIKKYFDYTSCKDDHLPNKPNPKSFLEFCEKFNFEPEEVAFVGDTTIDMKFAKKAKAGLKIGVLWGGYGRTELEPVADKVYDTLFDLRKDTTIYN